jgi:hypothetical protein
MGFRSILQSLECAFTGKRCLFCEREVCAFHPNGNPFKGTEYQKTMQKVKEIQERE